MKKILLFIVLPLILISFIAYSVWWFKKAGELEDHAKQLVSLIELASGADESISFSRGDISVSGYPFAFNITLDNIILENKASNAEQIMSSALFNSKKVEGESRLEISLFSNEITLYLPYKWRAYDNSAFLALLIRIGLNDGNLEFDPESIDYVDAPLGDFQISLKTKDMAIMYFMFQDRIDSIINGNGFEHIKGLSFAISLLSETSKKYGDLYDEYGFNFLLDISTDFANSGNDSIDIRFAMDGGSKMKEHIKRVYASNIADAVMENKDKAADIVEDIIGVRLRVDDRIRELLYRLAFVFSSSLSGDFEMSLLYDEFDILDDPKAIKFVSNDLTLDFGKDLFGFKVNGEINNGDMDMVIEVSNGTNIPKILKKQIADMANLYPEYKAFARPLSEGVDFFNQGFAKEFNIVDGKNYVFNLKQEADEFFPRLNGFDAIEKGKSENAKIYQQRGQVIVKDLIGAYQETFSE